MRVCETISNLKVTFKEQQSRNQAGSEVSFFRELNHCFQIYSVMIMD